MQMPEQRGISMYYKFPLTPAQYLYGYHFQNCYAPLKNNWSFLCQIHFLGNISWNKVLTLQLTISVGREMGIHVSISSKHSSKFVSIGRQNFLILNRLWRHKLQCCWQHWPFLTSSSCSAHSPSFHYRPWCTSKIFSICVSTKVRNYPIIKINAI